MKKAETIYACLRSQEALEDFTAWLESHGSEIHELDLERGEVLKSTIRGQVCCILKNGDVYEIPKPFLSAYFKYYYNDAWNGGGYTKQRLTSELRSGVVKQLIERDGDLCFYCANRLGDNPTVEHLLSKSSGGSNHIDNLVLAHERCNRMAASKSLVKKIELKIHRSFNKLYNRIINDAEDPDIENRGNR